MKKHLNIFTLLVAALVTGLSLAACSEDELDTNQYGSGVKLNAYGPNPVMRGGQLRFVGSNLDQIAMVRIPGVEPITSIEVVKSGVPSEIRITVPKDGPEVGYVTLVSRTDGELRTYSELTYTEPIEFTTFSPASVMPGDVLTIEGDYLNLVHMVEFTSGIQVSEQEFISHNRYKIEVKVPEDARTGKIRLLDVDLNNLEDPTADVSYNIIESENALIVGTPAIAKFSSPRGEAQAQGTVTVKQGETVTVTGSYFNLISSVKFGDEDNVVTLEDFTVSEDGKTLSFTLPAEAPDGSLNLVCRSEVEVPVGTIVTVAPSECVAAPSPVKAGQTLTISGRDMDVVVAVEMPNVADAISIQVSESQVVVSPVPDKAQEGNLILRMANGKGVEVPFTLVKPAVTGYDNANVSAGGALTIYGTDLDLVKSVTFGEGSDVVEVTPAADGKSISLSVPMNAKTGEPTLNLANATSINGPALTISEAVFCYATEMPGEDIELKAGGTMTLTVANGEKLSGVEIDGTECHWILAGDNKDQLIIGIPETAGPGSKVRLISSNGEITYTMDFTPNTEVNTVIWTGNVDLAGWSFNWQFGDNTHSTGEDPLAFVKMGLEVGDVIHLYMTPYNDWWQVQFFDGHWNAQTTAIGDIFGNGNNVNSGIASLENGCLDIPVSEEIHYQLTTFTDWGYCWILQGEGVVITKISVTHYNNLEQDVAPFSLWENQSGNITYPFTLSWSDPLGKVRIMRSGLADMKLVAGKSKMIFYKTPESTGMIQLNDANWKNPITDADLTDWSGGTEVLETVFTEDMMKCVRGETTDGWSETAFIIQGDGIVIKKIAILP
ncbi:MAG: hypothetical protein IJ928_05720 [Prevotella sp.]|nr:hypothetical protein [Prevotella sp.]